MHATFNALACCISFDTFISTRIKGGVVAVASLQFKSARPDLPDQIVSVRCIIRVATSRACHNPLLRNSTLHRDQDVQVISRRRA